MPAAAGVMAAALAKQSVRQRIMAFMAVHLPVMAPVSLSCSGLSTVLYAEQPPAWEALAPVPLARLSPAAWIFCSSSTTMVDMNCQTAMIPLGLHLFRKLLGRWSYTS
jgi:hypothetical protein